MSPERVPASSRQPEVRTTDGSTSDPHLLEQARRGNRSATDRLFGRYRPWLRRWARGRLPRWARDGDVDTSDLVQEALQHTFARLSSFESQHASALRAYLQRAVDNRIRDRLRRATRRLNVVLPETPVRFSDGAAPQHRALVDQESWGRYLGGLERLKDRERRLIVGRAELGYSYRQLAAMEQLSSAETARKAVGRALRRLVDAMSGA